MSSQQHGVPVHVGIIMDGNRRWARERGLPLMRGHQKGFERAISIAEHAFQRGIRFLTLYAFSTQNWNRTQYEVRYLMRLLLRMIDEQSRQLHKQGVKIKIIGTRRRLSGEIRRAIERVQGLTADNKKGTLVIAFNYESGVEMVDAVRAIVKERIPVSSISKRTISEHLYTAGIPDPDLIIRTSGEHRLSGFLLWQAAHSELYFTETRWPSFTAHHFDDALKDYAGRQRRFGR